ncbi:MAG: alpha/beta fold hydrolase [Polyangiaceae bacterium]|nr:alpha/beta fold hydrolase [Myxococcales bacterium]MCB9584867.1 alpha/beta fold hydrolase [Polyangiaceae bacterium]MCB9607560.1 alpha/beta fold hydrolase [Polyangiaceae bacterium]
MRRFIQLSGARSRASRRLASLALVLASLGLGAGCSCEEERLPPKPSQSAAVSSASAGDVPKAAKLEVVSFAAADTVPLKADLLPADSKTAPLLVLVHRFRGDRHEWAPLLDRLAAAPKQYRVVNVDLRGHGDSKSAAGGMVLDWGAMTQKEIPDLEKDIEAAIQFGLQGAEPKHIVLIGSSLGATLVAKVAARQPKVAALGLVCPGARLEGQDVYHAYAEVRGLPTFFASGNGDNVSRTPLGSLVKMARHSTLKEYATSRHSAQHVGADAPQLWGDLEDWLMQNYELEPPAPADAGAADATAEKPKGEK